MLAVFNPSKQRFYKRPRRFPMSEPSVAAARLSVVGLTCGLVCLLPAPKPHSHRLGFDRGDSFALVCSVAGDAPRNLVKATKVNGGFMNTRIYRTYPSW